MSRRFLAVDYGAKRTGLAVSDALGIAAHPLDAIVTPSLDETVATIVETVQEREVVKVVVGMPYLRSGMEGAACKNVRLFVSALRGRLPPQVEIIERDERFTTAEAEQLLRPTGKNRKQLKAHVDSTAAVVLLREYLEELGPL